MKHIQPRLEALTKTVSAILASIALACGVAVAQPRPATAQVESLASRTPPAATAIGPIGITVSDLDRAVEFYRSVLGFDPVSTVERAGEPEERLFGIFGVRHRTATLRLGQESIELTEFLAAAGGEGRPIPADSRSNDKWFQHVAIVVADMDRAYQHLREHRVRHASSGPQTLPRSNPNAGGISAFYFKDPDGHVLEIIHFPPGKGDPRWQRPTQSLFLGIDHTAIVVADTERSVAFYESVLGMRVAGTSENFGTEQEHLNNVFGARLRITSLRAPAGPGIEFLEYLAPSDGRAAPTDTRQNDLIAWRTSIIVPNPTHTMAAAMVTGATRVSPELVSGAYTGIASTVVLDPDGHAILLRAAADSEAIESSSPDGRGGITSTP